MKKILLLGGGIFQIPPIIMAKKLGLYTITVDYLPDNPGHSFSDEYHNISTIDKESVLELAKKIKIDGIVSYASDVSAPTAAYVAERLGLPTSPYQSVEILTHKDKFRTFLAKNGFNTPKAKSYSLLESEKAISDLNDFKMPVMLKPVDSSGSKGVKKINTVDELKSALDSTVHYSLSKRFIIEEYVEKSGYQIDGDGFSVDGQLVFRCFGNQHNDSSALNPFVPSGISFPYNIESKVQQKIHNELQKAISLLGMKNSAYNFEVRIDNKEDIYIMEIGPRNGGNLIPDVIKYATGVDTIKYTILSAIGEDCSSLRMIEPKGFWSSYIIHAQSEGIFQSVWIDNDFKKTNIVEYNLIRKQGERIGAYSGDADGIIGTMILRFSNMNEMLKKMDNMEKYLRVIIQ